MCGARAAREEGLQKQQRLRCRKGAGCGPGWAQDGCRRQEGPCGAVDVYTPVHVPDTHRPRAYCAKIPLGKLDVSRASRKQGHKLREPVLCEGPAGLGGCGVQEAGRRACGGWALGRNSLPGGAAPLPGPRQGLSAHPVCSSKPSVPENPLSGSLKPVSPPQALSHRSTRRRFL